MDLATQVQSGVLAAGGIDALERVMLAEPQVECPVYHHFGPGIYVREVHIAGGTMAIGHRQTQRHLNILLQGTVLIYDETNCTMRYLSAPHMFVGSPGRKAGYIVEDMVWQNIYATEERDVRVLEQMFLDKSVPFEDALHVHQEMRDAVGALDREDYAFKLASIGLSDAYVRKMSENTADLVPMPEGSWPVRIDKSVIEGYGIFITAPVGTGQLVAPARLKGLRTPVGRYTNHSANPNCRMTKLPSGDVMLEALRNIRGAAGGMPGEEATIDYWQALREIGAFA